jgi:flavorubredoxin/flavin reductase (DIM6/NTAB) family NADH-FMN oxidoreductase RutF
MSRDVQVLPVAPGITLVRSRSWRRLRFEIEYGLEKGTTANSFVIRGDGVMVIDPPGETFTAMYLAALGRVCPPGEIRYLLLQHLNPNRFETVQALLRLAPGATVLGSPLMLKNLRLLLSEKAPDQLESLQCQALRGDELLDLGQGHTLRFLLTPTPRYPDAIATFDQSTGIVFTDKFFGAHLCSDQVFDEGWESMLGDRRYYFDCLMVSQMRQVSAALDKIQSLGAQWAAPAHGPLLRYGWRDLQQCYRQWGEQQQQQGLTVVVLYASAYGNTTILAQALSRGITKAQVAVETINCEHAEPAEIREAIGRASGFLLGSPTLGGHLPTQMQTALGIVLSTAPKSLRAGVFGSYGWSGEAVDILAGKLQDAGYALAFEPVRVKFAPTAAVIQQCEELGTDFAQSLKVAKKVRNTVNPASDLEQAVGRVVGSLCVMTAQREELTTAMLASWVSQASFQPPGLTIAVAKERAIESYVYPGDGFVLNILPEDSPLMRAFAKRFAPGEDRFQDLKTTPSSCGAPILDDALAYLECRVQQRMECGDHWLIYAIAEGGKLLQANRLTAVHHRKTAGHY